MAVHRLRDAASMIIATGLSLAANAVSAAPADLSGYWMIEEPSERFFTVDGEAPPLKPAQAKIYEANSAAKTRGKTDFDPVVTRCTLPGMPRMMTLPSPIELLQTPKNLTILFAWNRLSRTVELTGKAYEPDYPLAAGVSFGHWAQTTLVVETSSIRGDTFFDAYGLPHSENTSIIEKLSLVGGATELVDDVTVADPDAFERPWRFVLRYRKLPDSFLFPEDVCLDRTDAGQPAVDYHAKWITK